MAFWTVLTWRCFEACWSADCKQINQSTPGKNTQIVIPPGACLKNSYICQNTHKSHKGNTAQVLCGVAFTFLHGIPFQTTGSESFKNIVFITRNVVKFIHDFLAFSNPYKFSEIRRITPAYAGKSFWCWFIPWFGGITPAYAGKSGLVLVVVAVHEDHPRLCGEKADFYGVTTDYLGSPPPMRGKVSRKFFRKMLTRITPAYAGKSHRANEV